MRTFLAVAMAVGVLTATVHAEADDAALVSAMQHALEPAAPNVRKLTMRVSGGEFGEASEIVVGQATGTVAGQRRILNVVLAPPTLRGTAFLVQDGGSDDDVQWLYLPAVGRVREVVSPEAYAAFLNSDFTYADLGFIHAGTRYRALGTTTRNGTRAVQIEGVPRERWYYGRIVTDVAQASGLPLERRLYDAANRLWKVERWQVAGVAGTPAVVQASMEDVQARTRTDVDVTAIRYGVTLPSDLLEPAHLSNAAALPLWADLGA